MDMRGRTYSREWGKKRSGHLTAVRLNVLSFLSCLYLPFCRTGCGPVPIVIAYNVGAAWYTETQGTQRRPPKVQPVTASYKPDLIDRQTPVFPPVRLLVLRAVDERSQPEVVSCLRLKVLVRLLDFSELVPKKVICGLLPKMKCPISG